MKVHLLLFSQRLFRISNIKTCRSVSAGRAWIMMLLGSMLCLASCQSPDSADSPRSDGDFRPVKIGLLPDTQGYETSVSIHPMKAVLQKLREEGAEIVIPVGDLTNHGTAFEFDQWTEVAEMYRDAGMEFLPLMGNHETSYAYSVEWIDYMKDYIPEDAVHMSGAEYSNYYVVRENVLIILLRHANLSVAFEWIKDTVTEVSDEIDHIVIASHDGLVGAKYGQTKGIVSGTKGNDLLMDQYDEIRTFFSRHDVIWVQGHEHMYQRSVISAPIHVDPVSWTPADRNYRLPQYTQIISGNASYKGYEFRFGERELVQDILQQKMNTLQNGSEALDANASLLTFNNSRVDYLSYVTSHTILDNDEGQKELSDPEWTVMDKFSRTADRCERLVYPNSIPEATRSVLKNDPYYRTNECFAADGSSARLLDGVNNTFNRIESTDQTLGWRPGFSRAESQMDLARLAYQYLFQYHQPWSPNLHGDRRIIPADDGERIEVPQTTMDLKEHITLSWVPSSGAARSDILIVSGTEVQTGMFSGAYGAEKDIEADPGFEGSQPDGSAKQPHALPVMASKSWNLETSSADRYVLQFENGSADPDLVTPAYLENGSWTPFTPPECILEEPYQSAFLHQPPVADGTDCEGEVLVGHDRQNGNRWWIVLNSDTEVALIDK